MIEVDPFKMFDRWFRDAQKAGIKEPESMNLATASKNAIPSNRTVLLKNYDEKGFVFYTNLESKKGCELSENPYAALCFHFKELDRQIRIEGKVEPVSEKEADEYFNSRPLQSRVGACISKQSRIIENDFDLLKEVTKKTLELAGKKITRPKFWSGFRVVANRIEFWQKGEFRIHKRKCYSLHDGVWRLDFLYP